jgi:2-polyprenyl-3-methyl-5-hydroxy-6-metoxy-1,4-benzoquinol methylase
MCKCCRKPVIDFFNSIASRWDSWEDPDDLAVKFDEGFDHFGIQPEERILDAGCGTGNLTAALLWKLALEGRVVAIDSSPKMIDVARGKIADNRVTWICDAIEHYVPDVFFHRIICYSVWPHFSDPRKVAAMLYAMLVPGGCLHIWHLISRERVNTIHAKAGEAVRGDVLPPVSENAALLAATGFKIKETVDDDLRYLITARKD